MPNQNYQTVQGYNIAAEIKRSSKLTNTYTIFLIKHAIRDINSALSKIENDRKTLGHPQNRLCVLIDKGTNPSYDKHTQVGSVSDFVALLAPDLKSCSGHERAR